MIPNKNKDESSRIPTDILESMEKGEWYNVVRTYDGKTFHSRVWKLEDKK